jgi:hypothetical protein
VLSSYEKGFLEGLIDGEGCICLSKTKTKSSYAALKPECSISNTCFNLLRKAQKIMQGGAINSVKRQSPKHNKCYLLKIGANTMRIILPQIRLIVKEHKRKTMLKVLKILLTRKGGFGTWNKNYKLERLMNLHKEFYA